MNKIGFIQSEQQKPDVLKEIDMLKRRVEAIENNTGNYQQYLKLKDQFEPQN